MAGACLAPATMKDLSQGTKEVSRRPAWAVGSVLNQTGIYGKTLPEDKKEKIIKGNKHI